MWKEFKAFILRGNVLDLAIAVIIGGAFGKIISSLVNDIIMPPIGLLLGKMPFTSLFMDLSGQGFATLEDAKAAAAPTINYGMFIQTIIDFVIVALVIFLVIRAVNKLQLQTRCPCGANHQGVPALLLPTIPLKATRCPNSKKLFSCGRTSLPRVRASCSKSLRCSAVRRLGTSTLTTTIWSPRPLPRRCGTPLPLRVKTLPGCVPAGIARRVVAVDGGHFDLGAQGGLGDVDVQVEQDIILAAAEELVRLDLDFQVQVAVRTAVWRPAGLRPPGGSACRCRPRPGWRRSS